MKLSNIYIILVSLFLVFGCTKDPFIVDGLAPIYISPTDFSYVHTNPPQQYGDLGNIVSVGNYLFINEKGLGIHVINNTDPTNPINEYFWSIPGNLDFTINGTILYADNSIHLLVIDISNFSSINVVNYTENVFLDNDELDPRPPLGYIGYFYCVDKTKGIHIGWSDTIQLTDPLCEAY